jgi:hypothetical protein
MTILCTAFRATPLLDQRIQLEIESPVSANPTDIDPTSTRVLYFKDVATKLRCDEKTIQQRSRRKRNPIPFRRGSGRPFILERDLFHYLNAQSCAKGYL